MVDSPTPINGDNNNTVNISTGDIILQDVQNPNQFVYELKNALQNNKAVKGVLNDTIDNRLVKGRNSFSVNRW